MFHAVRQWWSGGRGRITARLFLFELCVVIAGVLIAQALASEVARRGELARMERSDKLARVEMGISYGTALVWQRAGPCLADRMAEIMRSASTGPVPETLLARPALGQLVFSPLSPDELQLLREKKGAAHADLVETFASNAGDFNRRVLGVADTWGRMDLVNASFGEVTAADRVEARAAAADIRAHLRTIAIINRRIVSRSRSAGIQPIYELAGSGPAESCAAIWRSGRINPPVTMR